MSLEVVQDTNVAIGTQITWISSANSSCPGSGQYWIDGSEPVGLHFIPGSQAVPPIAGPFHFKVDGLLEDVVHNLTVVYNGSSSSLMLDHLLVQGGNYRIEPEWPQSPEASPPPDSTSSPSSLSLAVIAGGTIGGAVVVALAILAYFLLRRSRKSKNDKKATTMQDPDDLALYPVAIQPPSSDSGAAATVVHPPPLAPSPKHSNHGQREPFQTHFVVPDTARVPLDRQTSQQIRDILATGGVHVAARDVNVYTNHYHPGS